MMKYLIQLLLFTALSGIAAPLLCLGQVVSDTLELDPLYVEATRYDVEKRYQPVSVQRFDAENLRLFRGTDVGSLLSERSTVYVRDHGPGGISTVSMRGWSPRQVQILWNGFQLNHSMLGLFDMSLIPAEFITGMEVSSGNSSTAYGTGAAGGTVYLDSSFRFSGGSAWQTLGSYGKNLQGFKGGWNSENWHAGLMFQREDSENDFTYITEQFDNELGRRVEVTERRKNNELRALQGLASAGFSAGNFEYNTMAWWYDIQNQIPGGIVSLGEGSTQEDESLRWFQELTWDDENHRIRGRFMLGRVCLDFFDEIRDIQSESLNRLFTGDLSWEIRARPDLRVTQVLSLTHTEVETNNYAGTPSQWTAGYLLNTTWQPLLWLRVFGGIRYDYYEISGDAVSGSVGFNSELYRDRIILRGQASRNFVAPTFNDLFWQPSGNPDLNPETNRKAELGLVWLTEFDYGRTESEFTFFAGKQFDGIRWVPEGSTTVPINIDEIFNRGFELRTEQVWEIAAEMDMTTGMGVFRTRATVEKDRFEDDRTVGKQLIYVPEWEIQARVNLTYRSIQAGINYNWKGERFSSADHRSPLDPLSAYEVSNLYAGVEIYYRNTGLDLTARVQNLFDERYQVVRNYPMPGRHFQITARVTFNQNN